MVDRAWGVVEFPGSLFLGFKKKKKKGGQKILLIKCLVGNAT